MKKLCFLFGAGSDTNATTGTKSGSNEGMLTGNAYLREIITYKEYENMFSYLNSTKRPPNL